MALAYQLYRIRVPEVQGAKFRVVHNTSGALEGAAIGAALCVQTFLYAMSPSAAHAAGPVPMLLADLGTAVLAFGFRTKTVFDGQARTVTRWFVLPKRFAYRELRGLGIVEQVALSGFRVRRDVYPRAYLAGLIPEQGGPRIVYSLSTPKAHAALIEQLHADTGVPVVRGSDGGIAIVTSRGSPAPSASDPLEQQPGWSTLQD
jgi:hypothetical protein